MRAVRYVTAHRGDAESFRKSPLYGSIGQREPLFARLNNTEGLSKVYNLYLDSKFEDFVSFGPDPELHESSDIVVFVHDDVEVIGNNCVSELNRWADKGYSLLGLAGGAKAVLKPPTLWHSMTEPDCHSGYSVFQIVLREPRTSRYLRDPRTGRFIVDREQPCPSGFGPYREVVMLDGLFLAAVLDSIETVGLRFDERFKFHHYDLALCLQAHAAGLKMRTVFIPVVHWSVGLETLNDTFRESEATFLATFAPNGAVRVTV